MAAAIRKGTGIDAEIVEGNRSEFIVWVGDRIVAQKAAHAFPSDGEALAAVQEALARK